MSFVHLHAHSQFSLLEATCRISDLVDKALEYKMPAVALTDYGNMFGAVELYLTAKEKAIKPIIGLEVYLAPGSRFDKKQDRDNRTPNRRLVLLAENFKGYQNLCQISSAGYQEGFYYRPRVDYEVLNKYNENVLCLSGGLMGEVPWTFKNVGPDEARQKAQQLHQIYKDRFYLELNRTGIEEWKDINPFLLELKEDMGLTVVAANDVHYLKSDDQLAQEVLICIGSNRTLQDESRFRLGSNQFYYKSPEQMRELFKDYPQAIETSLEIADRCQVEFELTNKEGNPIYHLPSFPTRGGASTKDEMRRLAYEGLEKRFKEAADRGEAVSDEQIPSYHERLEHELKVIDGMGFNGYFLIVQDFIGWAKQHSIPVGPGRGSGAGSLVAFSLGITELDPMPYNLIFERFLNPERVSMPDFDIDFCQENRQRVIEYVTEKYGAESVSQIITYGKLQARAAVRDVGRVMGMTYAEVDVVSKLMPDKLGLTLEEAMEMEPRLTEMMEAEPRVSTLMDLAQKIEGLVRHAGIHAAGVIIADGNLKDHAPLWRGAQGESVVQYDMKYAEKIGLIKFDFLGLKTLTHIQDALNLIEKNRDKHYETKNISLADANIYKIMSEGDTAGIFQFEGEGITDLIKKAKPSCFEDIVALNALYRPGPMEKIPEYLEHKKGLKKIKYIFPELEPILKETYGIIIYQEQVQLIAAKIANYSLGEADILRRAMGKKIPEVMAKQKDRFLAGAKENNYDLKKAEELFDSMAEFAKYGFNKSHAAAYCVVAAQTAWLKANYPVEFFAALLSTEMSDTDKVVKYVKDAQKHDVEVLPPHISHSEYKFTVEGEKIFFSLGAIKGVGQSAVEAIVEAREALPGQQFESLEQFFEVIDLRRVNKKTIECLIKAGGLDGFGANRAELLNGYVKFIERADRSRKDKEAGQVSLFAVNEEVSEAEKVRLEELPLWSRTQRLAFEKEVLGFFLSDHPLKGMDTLVKPWTTGPISELGGREHKSPVAVAGMISGVKEIITKKGTRMAFAQLEDLSGHLELIIFPKAFEKLEMRLKSESPVLIKGQLGNENDTQKIYVEEIERIDDILKKAKSLTLNLDPECEDKFEKLKLLMDKYPGETNVSLFMRLSDISMEVQLEMTEGGKINPSSEFFEKLHGIFGTTDRVRIQ